MQSGATRVRERESADPGPVPRGPAHPLDSATRASLEPRFGHDFSRVRVHAYPAAAAAADSLGARAYTFGNDVVFGANEYRPGTAEGQSLLAHELTHVVQQRAGGPRIQRAPKGPKSGSAASSPRLVVSEKQPACACLVFMHHSEQNALAVANAMAANCNYNYAIVKPSTERKIDIPKVGKKDPNELFPRHIFRECVDKDKPCQDFLDAHKDETKDKAVIEEYVQRDFFLSIKKCSSGFKLPIVALHNNVIDDTQQYHNALDKERDKKNLDKIEKKTFVDTEPEKGYDESTRPYAELEAWLKENFPDLVKDRSDKAKNPKDRPTWKKTIISSDGSKLMTRGMTNILFWCQSHDNAQCYIGNPGKIDNVVWVTREEDFKRLQGTDANVVLQTRVTPEESEEDLSSMFVASPLLDAIDRMEREEEVTPTVAAAADEAARKAGEAAKATGIPGASALAGLVARFRVRLDRLKKAMADEAPVLEKRKKIRYVNIETPQSPGTPEQRGKNFRDVRTILRNLDLHCCNDTADEAIQKKLDPPKKK